MDRRAFLASGAAAALGLAIWPERVADAAPKLRVTGFELLPVRATERTVWLIVRLKTDAGLTGLGEASDAFGFDNTTKAQATRMETELRRFFGLVDGTSPLDIRAYRAKGEPLAAKGGLVSATAYSAIEQALWDLAGKALDVPTYTLFGGKIRDTLPVYANINRATNPRTPGGFAASAEIAVAGGFRAVKAAPWDGFPPEGSSRAVVEAAIQAGIACVVAMRNAIGPDIELMVDCHSNFDVPMAERVASILEPQKLAWFEEPVPPTRLAQTREIHSHIRQPMAGGELLFGVAGFAGLCRDRTVDVIMPDVKHCGGLLEMTRIAAAADQQGVQVAPHNPSGPISTAAGVQMGAVLKNFRLLELQTGEAAWRGDVVTPPERFEHGAIAVPDRPGFGIELNEAVVRAHLM
ncbi:MAG TPA: mandelate racemase/muconate lactonizing enzyme family protein [Vicinamibacterales bacterium]|nr:mandelate racemase/muconate lactonizing enzyme family protein [Vicinamibacterales bacterium]